MRQKRKTFYLWDLANTLFPEEWDKEKTGLKNFDEYVKSLGYDLKKILPLEYERCYEIPYKEGLYKLKIADGFREVLSWTKNNIVFTTGNKEQTDWRAEYFSKQGLFDPRPYLKEIHSTFDFGNTNKKTKEMLINLINQKIKEGYNEAVYIDDNLNNCLFFLEAAKEIKGFYPRASSGLYFCSKLRGIIPRLGVLYPVLSSLVRKRPPQAAGPSLARSIIEKKFDDFEVRVYHIKNDNLGIRKKENYWEIGNLYDLMENEASECTLQMHPSE